MAGQENLIPMSERSEDEVRELGRKGGIASGETRREKATMKKVLEQMLEEVADIKDNEKKLTYKQLATLGLIKGSIDGNASNYKTILEVIGEMSAQTEAKEPIINININNNEELKEEFYKEENNG